MQNRSFLPQRSNSFGGLSPDLQAKLGQFQTAWGKPLSVISGYRDPAHNARVGGARGSQHMQGNAVDLDVSGLSEADRIRKIQMARSMGFGGIGVYPNSLHFDIGSQRAWGPDYTSATIPAAYRSYLGGPAPEPQAQAPTPAPRPNLPVAKDAKPEHGVYGFGSTQAPEPQRTNAFSGATWTDPNTVKWSDGTTNAFGPEW